MKQSANPLKDEQFSAIRTTTPSEGNEKTSKEETAFPNWQPISKIAKDLYVSPRTLYNWRKKRVIPFSRIRGKILYNRDVIEELLRTKWNMMIIMCHTVLLPVADADIAAGLFC